MSDPTGIDGVRHPKGEQWFRPLPGGGGSSSGGGGMCPHLISAALALAFTAMTRRSEASLGGSWPGMARAWQARPGESRPVRKDVAS